MLKLLKKKNVSVQVHFIINSEHYMQRDKKNTQFGNSMH